MRIGVNASIIDPILSGLGTYTVHLLRELVKLHDDLVVYTSCPEVCGIGSTKVRRISPKVQPFHGRKGHLHRLAWIQTILPFRLLIDRASLLLSPMPEGMLFPVIPQVVVVHDVLPLHFPEEYPRQQHYFRYFVPMILRKARAVVADSENTKRDIMTCYGIGAERIRVVLDGYDNSRYRVGIDAEGAKKRYGLAAYLLYVGNLLPHKNLHRLLNAFALISKRFPHRLVIAGRKDPRYYPALEAEARALGLEKRVSFLDYVPQADLPALYAGAEAFVFPSLYEGFGLPVLEAMACGTPVITSHISSLPEVAGEAALLIDPYDKEKLAGAMEAVLSDPWVREDLRQKGLKQAERFSWERTAKTTLEILLEAGNR
ncbi:MAG: glycosyltransferase family 4 protein [candidate division NC10 bacterium]|nr:glycosyltransferase family 4 protein [candidate division NC10 bacterium]MDE2322834.1 glycosyltransferase family 4 protein [candidate division NC10 bacterium]